MPEGTQPTELYVVLAEEVTSGQITVSLESFLDFCEQMDNSLETLRDKWQHLAAPGAEKLRRATLP